MAGMSTFHSTGNYWLLAPEASITAHVYNRWTRSFRSKTRLELLTTLVAAFFHFVFAKDDNSEIRSLRRRPPGVVRRRERNLHGRFKALRSRRLNLCAHVCATSHDPEMLASNSVGPRQTETARAR